MTAQSTAPAARRAGAASHAMVDWRAIDWRAIDWQQANQNVRRLQARLVKATQAGRWGKVRALHRLLTHSFSGKALAVRRVTENQGKRTPGVDGETWDTPAQKARAVPALRQRGYHASGDTTPSRSGACPSRRRPVSCAHWVSRRCGTGRCRRSPCSRWLALDPIAETTGDPNSYGFRTERSTADAIGQCYQTLAKRDRATWVLEGDIKSCFDSIGSATRGCWPMSRWTRPSSDNG